MKENPNTNKNLIYKLQKTVIFAIFFSMIFLFVYSLIFFTPFYELYTFDAPFLKSKANSYGVWNESYPTLAYSYSDGKIVGLDMHYFVSFTKEAGGYGGELQVFNHFLFNFGLIGIIVSAISFLFYSQKRKVYYFTNYFFLGISCLFGLVISFYGISRLISWSSYLKTYVNYDVINAYKNSILKIAAAEAQSFYSYETFRWVFALGYIVFALIIIFSICGIVYGILRFVYQKKNPPMDLSGVNIDE